MIVLLCSPLMVGVKPALQNYSEDVYVMSGVYDSQGIKVAVQEAQRMNPDILVLDVDAGPENSLANALFTFRLDRPGTRVLVLAAGRQPGDRLIGKLVGYTIFDIVAGDKDDSWGDLVSQALAGPPADFQKASRWIVSPDQEVAATKEIVIKEVLKSTVSIGITGCAHGVGCTHLALSIANWLDGLDMRVAVAEYGEKRVLWRLKDHFKKCKDIDGYKSFALERVDYYVRDYTPGDILGKKYPFAIFDFGYMIKLDDKGNILPNPYLDEFNRCTVKLLIVTAAPWRYRDIDAIKGVPQICNNDTTVLVNFHDPNSDEQIGRAIPFNANPYSRNDETRKLFVDLLGEFLPVEKISKPKKTWFPWGK